MQRQREFCVWVGELVPGHIAMGCFSEECFPCLCPTTVLAVVPDAWFHILFTRRKRRKNDIDSHSLHTSSLLDADIYPVYFRSNTILWCIDLTVEPRSYRGQSNWFAIVLGTIIKNPKYCRSVVFHNFTGIIRPSWHLCCQRFILKLLWVNQFKVMVYYMVILKFATLTKSREIYLTAGISGSDLTDLSGG